MSDFSSGTLLMLIALAVCTNPVTAESSKYT